MPDDTTDEWIFLLDTAHEAGRVVRKYFTQPLEQHEKAPLDLVTEADLASESLIRQRLRDRFPHDAVTGEEEGASTGTGRRWFIDPIDGTVNYAHGVPIFAVCLALADDEGPLKSIVYNPITEECSTAQRGQGAFRSGIPIHCSDRSRLADAHIYVNPHGLRTPGKAGAVLDLLGRVGSQVQGMLNPASMSIALCWVACGRLDAAVALDVDQYSTPASALVMLEAGVQVTDLQGNSYQPGVGSLLAAGPALYPSLMTALRTGARRGVT